MLVTLAIVAFTLNGVYLVKGVNNTFTNSALCVYNGAVMASFLAQ